MSCGTGPLFGSTLAVGARLLGGHGGHHGLRIIILVLIVVAIAVGIVLFVRRSRRRREGGGSAHETPPLAPEPRAPKPVPTPQAVAEPASRAPEPARRALEPADRAAEPAPSGPSVPAATPRAWRDGNGKRASGIAASDLTKRYGEKVAVDDLSFEVTPGRVTGFLGPNGAGKSTTMRLVMGLDRPDAGSVTVNGRPYHELAWPLREVGALLEAKATHPGRSAFAHLSMLAKANRIPRRRVDEVLDLVGLSLVAGKRVGEYSLGMGQRLGIAAAMLGDPGVVMFDEPVNGLDTDGIRWVRQLLRQLASEGRSVFVSSHLMSEMAKTADELVVIGRGRLIAQMPVAEFTSRYATGYIRVRSPQVEELRKALEEAGASVVSEEDRSISVRGMSQDAIGETAWRRSIMLQELAPQSASLEEAFMESTEAHLEFGGVRDEASAARPGVAGHGAAIPEGEEGP
jgi:ABC-2 type transport system ATP-binding protein